MRVERGGFPHNLFIGRTLLNQFGTIIAAMIGSVGGVAGMTAVMGLVLKAWPSLTRTASTWLYSHIDPERLPYGSAMNRHWEQQRQIAETQQEIRASLAETQRDIIKNTILQLVRDSKADHSREVAYELSKLEDLESRCWVMDVARDYITSRMEGTDE